MNETTSILHMLGAPGGTDAREPRSLAVVGLSDNPDKASYSVSAYMQAQGYRILPVNPAVSSVLGEVSYPSLAALPVKPDVVNVFRLPKFVPAIVDEMITLGLTDVWVQLGIRSPVADMKAEVADIRVVMDRCIMIEHRRFGIGRLPGRESAPLQ